MAVKKKVLTRWYDGNTPLEELDASEQIAHEIVLEFGDLAPSVTRIMEAEITEDQRVDAMVLFRDSLGGTGDPNRDPRVAIATASK
jgi:hypothetical protein